MERTLNLPASDIRPTAFTSYCGEKLYASEDGRVAPLSAEECLFVVKTSSEPHVMTLQVVQALDACREFRGLDEHVARIEATIPALAGKRDDIRRVVESLIQRKVLVSDDDFLARLRNGRARTLPPMSAVFIRACDRPERLAHLLDSLNDYERRYRADRSYVLIDDSAAASDRDKQRDRLLDFGRTTGCDVRYVGAAEAAKLAERLAACHPRARAAVSALLLRNAHPQASRFGGGRSRNLALLLSAGSRLALFDDDLLLPLRRPAFAGTGLDPNPNAPSCTRFYSNMGEALAGGGVEVDEDPFELHLRICGQDVGTCIDGLYPLSRDALRGLNLGQMSLLKSDARIVSTHHGSYGSSRSESTLWLYHAIDDAGREEFWRDRESYLRNTQAHHIVVGAARARVAEIPGFTPFTLDNTALLPCTNPVGRAEDSFGAALTHYCRPDSLSLELPVLIGHVQESLRKRVSNTQRARLPRVNDFLRDFVTQQFAACKSADAAERMTFLSHIMRDLAGAPVNERLEHLTEYRRFVHADIVNRLQQQLEATAATPLYWQADARAIVEVNAKEMLAGNPPRLAEWPDDIDAAGCARALGSELNMMADACQHWPALWQHAAEHNGELLATVAAPP